MVAIPLVPRAARGIFFALLLAGAAQAAPYRPASDAEVLERVPRGPARAGAPELGAAVTLARQHIERARAEGDPRWLGYAQGALQPWWSQARPPPPVLLLRATLLQSRHQFDAALADLDLLLRQAPDDAQAWLTRATILRVQGRYAEARKACAELVSRSDDFVPALCLTALDGLAGKLRASIGGFEQLEDASRARPPELRAWYWAERAEALERSGRRAAAESAYQLGLAAAPGDLGLRAAYADFLLDAKRPEAALLALGEGSADALRLRRALALADLGRADAALAAALADGFAAARRRGEDLHLREEARFELELAQNPARALELARENWKLQREPWDARLLLAAAAVSGQRAAAQPARDWMRATGYEDARLEAWP